MRKNLPVTQKEFALDAGCTLVSVTDPSGLIQYCNPAFVAVSGYRREELIGQPHNLIRHPDMPAEAFRDMWATIREGLPWSGLVKNRRKDGDHYWVRANVTPVLDGDRVTGYMSVRTVPSRAEVETAADLYQRMSTAATGEVAPVLRLDRGELVPRHPLGRMLRFWRRHDGWAAITYCSLPPALALGAWGAVQGWGGSLMLGWSLSVALALGGALGAAHLVRRTWVGPLESISSLAHRMAAGDLSRTIGIRHHGAVGMTERALSQLSVNLRAIVNGTREGVDMLNHAAQDLAQGGQDLCVRTEAQSAGVQQSASSLEQISGTVKQSAQAARNLAAYARRAEGITAGTSADVQAVTETMSSISASSHRIRDITQVIDGIAFQTNILALNAAVEAARAGEQGRGFAVVAAEVRALAQRSSSAAREIRQLIEGTVEQIDVGARQTGEARRSMDEALTAVKSMGTLVEEIDVGSNEQSLTLAQVHTAVEHIDGITQQNAALVEELAASAESVRVQTQAVSETVQMFRLD